MGIVTSSSSDCQHELDLLPYSPSSCAAAVPHNRQIHVSTTESIGGEDRFISAVAVQQQFVDAFGRDGWIGVEVCRQSDGYFHNKIQPRAKDRSRTKGQSDKVNTKPGIGKEF